VDTGPYADKLRRRLAAFQFESIFQDREEIQLGENFADEIREGLAGCDAVLVLIGPRWPTVQDAAGRKRLDDPTDWVRREVTLAWHLKRPVIPVLFDGAQMPSAETLPNDLEALATAQGYAISGNYFDRDADYLARELERALLTRRQVTHDSTSAQSGFLTQLKGIWIGLCVLALGFAVTPFFAPALPRIFWVFPASMAVPAFLYWMYLQGEVLRPRLT
jgi:hypothetical protein